MSSVESTSTPADPTSPLSQESVSRTGSPARRLQTIVANELGGLRFRLLLVSLFIRLLPYHSFSRLRAFLYRLAGVKIGPGTAIMGRIDFGGTQSVANLRIGAHCVLNAPIFADLNAAITIGDHVHLGHHLVLITAAHEIGSSFRRGGDLTPRPIIIEAGCLIGARVTILPGVCVGAASIVSAGSVVAASVPAGKVVGGNPARVIKALVEAR